MNPRRAFLALALATSVGCSGGSGPDEAAAPEAAPAESAPPLVVGVVNYPLAFFAERIGGEHVSVHFPAPSDADPAYWSPDPDTVAGYQAADLVLLNGADYAKWVAQVSLPAARLVDTGAAYADRLIPLEDAVTHTHGPEGEHAHAGVAFTTWLDPTLAVEQARAIAAAFEGARPRAATEFRESLALLESELGALDTRLEAAMGALGDAPVVFSHPVYQYLQRRYGLDGRSVHWEPDAEPSGHDWRHFAADQRKEPALVMLWEGEPLPALSGRLEELGIAVVVFDPCGTSPESGDYLSVMGANVDRLEAALAEGR